MSVVQARWSICVVVLLFSSTSWAKVKSKAPTKALVSKQATKADTTKKNKAKKVTKTTPSKPKMANLPHVNVDVFGLLKGIVGKPKKRVVAVKKTVVKKAIVKKKIKVPTSRPVHGLLKKLSKTKTAKKIRPSLHKKPRIAPKKIRKHFVLKLAKRVNPSELLHLQLGAHSTHVSTVGASNWFGVQIPTEGWYVFQTKGHSDPYCTLYTANSLPLARNDDSGERRNCRIIQRLKPGSYLLEVMLLPHKRMKYTVKFAQLKPKTLTMEAPVKGRLAWPGSLQIYQFDIKTKGRYQLSTTGRADTVCLLLNMTSRKLRIISRDDDSGVRRNCSLSWQFKTGLHTMMITGSYFGRGAYTLSLKSQSPPVVNFKALTFGKIIKDRITPDQLHRFRFNLRKSSRITIVTAMSRTTPQMYLLNSNGQIIHRGGYSNKRGKLWIFTRQLKAGTYDFALRSAGKPRGTYKLYAHIEGTALLPANRARPVHDGFAKTLGKEPFIQSTFHLTLKKGYYSVLTSQQPNLVACILESLDGKRLAVDWISKYKPRPCRLAEMNRSGSFLFRTIRRKPRKRKYRRRRRRLSYRMRRLLRRNRMRRLLRRLRRRRLRRRHNRNFRKLYRKPIVPKKPKKRSAKQHRHLFKPVVLPLINSNRVAQVRFYQVHPTLLAGNQAHTTHKSGALYFQVDVPHADLYWFSTRGAKVKNCQIERIFGSSLKQSELSPTGCDVASYLKRGSYMFRVNTGSAGRRTISWRAYRSLPSTLAQGLTVIGPVKQGQSQTMRVRIVRNGYYKITAKSTSSIPLKTACLLKKGRRTIIRPLIRKYSHKLEGYLPRGVYQLHVRVKQGHGAYTIQQVALPSFRLALGQKRKKTLSKYKESHFYTLRITRSGLYKMGTSGKTDTHCTLYNSSNRRLAYNDDSGPGRNCLLIRRLTVGRYALKIRNIQRFKGQYQVSYQKTTTALVRRYRKRSRRTRTRHYNWRRTRRAPARTVRRTIRVGRAYTNLLRNKRDTHLYRVRIVRSGRYTFETKGPANRTDTKCYIYKGTRLIKYDDDHGYRLHCRAIARLTPGLYKIRVVLALSTRAGTYQLSIRRTGQAWPRLRGRLLAKRGRTTRRGRRARNVRARRGRYWLGTMRRGKRTPTKHKRPTLVGKKSPLQIIAAKAMTLKPGLRTQAMAVSQTRVDVYKVQIPAAGTYTIATDGNLDTKCYLDDSRGGVLAANEDGGDAANCQIRMRLPYGTYTLRVLARPVGRFGPYGITLKIRR